MRIDREYVLDTLTRLVRINSINPTLVPGAPGEREIGEFIAESMRGAGLSVEVFEPEPGRPSVVGRVAGTGGGRSLMLNAHCDTVDVAGMAEPFSGEIRDGKLYGRGSYDMKGSLAACMAAAKALADCGIQLRGDVVVAAVADEEYGSLTNSPYAAGKSRAPWAPSRSRRPREDAGSGLAFPTTDCSGRNGRASCWRDSADCGDIIGRRSGFPRDRAPVLRTPAI